MQQLIKKYLWAVLLVASAPVSWGFALLGPPVAGADATWQTTAIGYNLQGDIGTPRNIGEEYRRNTPFLYYDYDANLSGYFGSNGEAAVDSAMAILNSVTNLDNYTNDFNNDFPLNSQQVDMTAYALDLTDLKSTALYIVMEQIGLAEPERYTWTLHYRTVVPGSQGICPGDMEYLVVQRNFDPTALELNQSPYSYYVNGVQYNYQIEDNCGAGNTVPALPDLAVAQPILNDEGDINDIYSAVAGMGDGLKLGGFYQGLTRDDVAGMRYLYSTNNVLYETPSQDSVQDLITTNTTQQQTFPNILLGTNLFYTALNPAGGVVLGTNGFNYYYYYDGTYGYGDYSALVALSKITSPANLQLLYPGLVIASTSSYLAYVTNVTPNYSFQYPVGKPIGTPPVLVATYTTNVTFGLYYNTTFGNVYTNFFTNHFNTAISASYMVTNILQYQPGKPLGSAIVTNITSSLITNYPGSEFFLMTAFYNTNCPLAFLSSPAPLASVYYTTNLVAVAVSFTNNSVTNNITNNVIYTGGVAVVTAFTNYTYAVNPVTCAQVTNTANWYQGVGRLQFIRQPDSAITDPLTDEFTTAVTNFYTMVNANSSSNALITQYFQRVVLGPDILFSAADLASPFYTGPKGLADFAISRPFLNFNLNNILPSLSGPGTISPYANPLANAYQFDKVGNSYGNGSLVLDGVATNQYLGINNQYGLLQWASFTGGTNNPVLYPNGISLTNIENQLIVSITPTSVTVVGTNIVSSLSNGTNGTAYNSVQFSASGGVYPYSWSLGAGTALPSGLVLSSGGLLSGTPTGAPVGTYDFTIQVTDSANRVVNFPGYTITIH